MPGSRAKPLRFLSYRSAKKIGAVSPAMPAVTDRIVPPHQQRDEGSSTKKRRRISGVFW
jgi:hypothetical protein